MAALGRRHAEGADGFTLVELLVVVVIMGILIAIAIPVYLNYQKGARDKAAESDVRSAIGILQQCENDSGSFPTSSGTYLSLPSGYQYPACTGGSVTFSGVTNLSYYAAAGNTPDSYIVAMSAVAGSGRTYCFSSAAGGSIAVTTTPVNAYRATC